jgi:hypothetical protein
MGLVIGLEQRKPNEETGHTSKKIHPKHKKSCNQLLKKLKTNDQTKVFKNQF